jgi:hypothetical protein
MIQPVGTRPWRAFLVVAATAPASGLVLLLVQDRRPAAMRSLAVEDDGASRRAASGGSLAPGTSESPGQRAVTGATGAWRRGHEEPFSEATGGPWKARASAGDGNQAGKGVTVKK